MEGVRRTALALVSWKEFVRWLQLNAAGAQDALNLECAYGRTEVPMPLVKAPMTVAVIQIVMVGKMVMVMMAMLLLLLLLLLPPLLMMMMMRRRRRIRIRISMKNEQQ